MQERGTHLYEVPSKQPWGGNMPRKRLKNERGSTYSFTIGALQWCCSQSVYAATDETGPEGPRSHEASFNLGEAKKNFNFFQSKDVLLQNSELDGRANRLAGKSLSDVLLVEICAGSARLARACRHVGCRSVAVGKTAYRSHGARIFCLWCYKAWGACNVEAVFARWTTEFEVGAFCTRLWHCVQGKRKAKQGFGRSRVQSPKILCGHNASVGGTHPAKIGLDQNPSCKPCLRGHRGAHQKGCGRGVVFLWKSLPTVFWILPYIEAMLHKLDGYDCIFDNCVLEGHKRKKLEVLGISALVVTSCSHLPREQFAQTQNLAPTIRNSKVQYQ